MFAMNLLEYCGILDDALGLGSNVELVLDRALALVKLSVLELV